MFYHRHCTTGFSARKHVWADTYKNDQLTDWVFFTLNSLPWSNFPSESHYWLEYDYWITIQVYTESMCEQINFKRKYDEFYASFKSRERKTSKLRTMIIGTRDETQLNDSSMTCWDSFRCIAWSINLMNTRIILLNILYRMSSEKSYLSR
jgi:hypothetical protein